MRYLLDTCVVMNMIAEPDRLCPDVEALIDDYENILCISAETLREMIVAFNNKDPSDHVIISQAITEHLPLVSSDTRFPFYREQGLDLIENR